MLGQVAVIATTLVAATAAVPTTLDARTNQDKYVAYSGNGSTKAKWPAMSDWASYDELWKANEPLMEKSCGWNNWGAENSKAEIADIKSSIDDVAKSAGVDKRFILTIIMQESKGCVRVPITNNGVRNPGLMQSHDGTGNCAGTNPCPKSTILQMIKDGVEGTKKGDGIKQTLKTAKDKTKDDGARAYYAAARLYNSGSADYNNLNDGKGSTPCYASDVANRFTGWTLAASKCSA